MVLDRRPSSNLIIHGGEGIGIRQSERPGVVCVLAVFVGESCSCRYLVEVVGSIVRRSFPFQPSQTAGQPMRR